MLVSLTHHEHDLGVGETRLMGELESTDKLLDTTLGHGWVGENGLRGRLQA